MLSTEVVAMMGTGFCGALTTYSTFGFESVRLLEQKVVRHAVVNVVVSIAAWLAAATVGVMIGGAILLT